MLGTKQQKHKMHKRLLLFTIWVLQMQSFSFSEAEDFNPLDHIIPNQKRVIDPKSEGDLHQNERCRCTCPGKSISLSFDCFKKHLFF